MGLRVAIWGQAEFGQLGRRQRLTEFVVLHNETEPRRRKRSKRLLCPRGSTGRQHASKVGKRVAASACLRPTCTRVCNNQSGAFGGRVCKEPARETKKLKGALLLCTLVELRFEGKSEFYGRDPTYRMLGN